MKRSSAKEWIGYGWIFACIVLLDQFSKYLVLHHLRPVDVYDLWPGVFRLNYEENTGAAFSMMSGKKWFTIGFATVALIVFVVYMIKNYRNSKLAMIFSAMVVGGGIGNLIDRVRIGYVVDYIEVRLFRFAIFNFADICVTVGIIILMIFILFGGKSSSENKQTVSEESNDAG